MVAAYHDDWLYFANRFGLDVTVFMKPKPGLPPSPALLVDVIAQIRTNHIKAILFEPDHKRKIAERVAHVVDTAQYLSGLPNTGTYIQPTDVVISRISSVLKN